MSSYEEYFEKLLKKNKIQYKKEVTFPDLHKKNALRFDFGIYEGNKLLCIVEIDGEQHFKPVEMFGGYSSFVTCKAHDRIKNKYCLRKNIPLYRIPYYDINTITPYKVFTNPIYRVISEFHNDHIINEQFC